MANAGVEHQKAVVFAEIRTIGIGVGQRYRVGEQLRPLGADLRLGAAVTVGQCELGKRVRPFKGARKNVVVDLHPSLGDDLVVAGQRLQMALEVFAVVGWGVVRKGVIRRRLREIPQVELAGAGRGQPIRRFEREIHP